MLSTSSNNSILEIESDISIVHPQALTYHTKKAMVL